MVIMAIIYIYMYIITTIQCILLLVPEIFVLILKVLYYICKDTYRMIVPPEKKSVAGEIVLDTGSVKDRLKTGRPKTATNEDNTFAVCASVVENVHTSVRKIAQQTGIGKSSVHEISDPMSISRDIRPFPLFSDTLYIMHYHTQITGAGHGIGKELAIGYALLGATVVCWDMNEKTNNETMSDIKRLGKESVYAYRCNVADREEVFRVAEKVKKEVGDVTILVNNAGIAFTKTFLNHSHDEITRVIDVNVIAHYWTLKAFLPNMIEKNHGHIVALSSVAGLVGAPYGTVYCPSKFAVKAFMEAVSEELRVLSNGQSSIKFTTIYPVFVRTGLIKKSPKIRFPRLMGELQPQNVAPSIIDAQRRNYKNKSIPSHWLPISKILRYLPEEALGCIMDFFDISVFPDD